MTMKLKTRNGFVKLGRNWSPIIVKDEKEIKEELYRKRYDLRDDYSVGGFERELIEELRFQLRRQV
jgi:hypothetical protein